jgi:hypothetical protein
MKHKIRKTGKKDIIKNFFFSFNRENETYNQKNRKKDKIKFNIKFNK